MNTKENRAKLKHTTDKLLQSEDDYQIITEAIKELHILFASITDIKADLSEQSHRDTFLNCGKALSPEYAAACLKEFMRTRQFLRGVQAGIETARKRFRGQKIHVLYAGCGPYALLLIPMITRFTSGELSFTLLDIHEKSLQAVRKLIDAFDIADYVQELRQGDASNYVSPGDLPVHMLVIETMQRLLAKEPQVALTLSLAPQLEKEGILIPERVSIDAYLCDPRKEHDKIFDVEGESETQREQRINPHRIELGRLFELDREISEKKTPDRGNGSEGQPILPAGTISIPETPGKYTLLNLHTTIQVFGQITLKENQCSLTIPRTLHDLREAKISPKIEFYYLAGPEPELKHRYSGKSKWFVQPAEHLLSQ